MQSAAGDLTPITLLVCAFLCFIFSPIEMGGWAPFLPTVTWHQHLHTHVTIIPLPLVSSKRKKTGKLHFWVFLGITRDTSDALDGTYCPWETEVKPILWNRDYLSHHWEASTLFLKSWCPVLLLNTYRAIMVMFILWSMRFNAPIISLTKPFVYKGMVTVQMEDLSQGNSICSGKLKCTVGIKYFNPES